MIYIHPLGGLGNILFHIASIWTLAKDNDDELCLLNIEEKIANLIKDKRCDISHARDYIYLFNRFKILNIEKPNINYNFEYKPLMYINEHKYTGYFQSEKYFKHRRDELLELFKPPEEFNIIINKYSHLYGNISLHVRRGDYVNLYPNIHPPQSIEYYNKALSILPDDMKVVVFSDDIFWCRQNFIGKRFIIIDEIDYISIYIMSKMKHHIIANSSFSWWGAWMSNYDDKIVIAPSKWFGDETDSTNIVPSDWIKI